MAFSKWVIWKILKNFWREQIPDFGASVYADLARAKESFYSSVAKEIIERVNERNDIKNILDIGTGPGFMLFKIAELKRDLYLVGVDLSKKMIAIAEKEKKERGAKKVFFLVGDANKMNFMDSECDFIISSGVLHSLRQPALAIKEWLRILRPGGDIWIYDVPILIKGGKTKNTNRLEKNLKDKFIFRLLLFINRNFQLQPLSEEKIKNMIEDTKEAKLIAIEYKENHLKISIEKNK